MDIKGHEAVRPLEVVRDEKGNEFLCDKGVKDIKEGLRTGLCVADERLAFTRND